LPNPGPCWGPAPPQVAWDTRPRRTEALILFVDFFCAQLGTLCWMSESVWWRLVAIADVRGGVGVGFRGHHQGPGSGVTEPACVGL
jgi:hypothetical protein